MEQDVDPLGDIDPSLSLNADGLWSDVESENEEHTISDEEHDGRTPRRTRRKYTKEQSPQIKALLVQASSQYASGDLQSAKTTIHEIIKLDNTCVQAYALLSQIYEDWGQKTEAVNALVSAALNSPKDESVWIRAARMSKELGFWQQAIKCLDALNPDDLDLLYERSVIHAGHGSAKKAIEGFMTLLKTVPMDMTVTRELAKVYNTHDRNKDAVTLYEDSRNYYMRQPQSLKPDGDIDTPFDWNELNVFLGLLSNAENPDHSIRIIHSTSRWLRGRGEELFWDTVSDSREWDNDDSRRSQVQNYVPGKWDSSRYSLPMEIRVRLGINWLRANNFPEAMRQFKFLDNEDVDVYLDLYWDVAEALAAHSQPGEALKYYSAINDRDQYNSPITWAAMGRCYQSLKDFQAAEECYLMCAQENPTDFESRLRLAEILEITNRKEEAVEVIATVVRDREELKNTTDVQTAEPGTTGALIPNRHRQATSNLPKPRRTDTEREELEARLKERILFAWEKLEMWKQGMEEGNIEDVKQWMLVAKDLINEFKAVKAFFPLEKGKRITWFDEDRFVAPAKAGRKRRRVGDLEFEMRVEELQTRLAEPVESNSEPAFEEPSSRERQDLSRHEFRGLQFEQWFYIFMQYALLLAQQNESEEEQDILRTAFDANIFFQNPRFLHILYTVHLACAIHAKDKPRISNLLKWFMQVYQFRSDAYRLYYLALGTDLDGSEQFRNANDQRFLLRHLKALDGVLTGEFAAGAAAISDEPGIPKCEVTRPNPVLLILYGHRLAASASYGPAQNYYLLAKPLIPDDPLLDLSMGLAYLHRGIQRQADNRHILVLQAMTFIFQYYRSCYSQSNKYPAREGTAMKQQAEYNVARAFHQLGLFTFAVKYYTNALKLSEEFEGGLGKRDLKFEAAHNLNLIYCFAENYEGAKVIAEKYLVL